MRVFTSGNGLYTFFEITKFVLLIAVTVFIIIMLVATPLLISGNSMEPNFHNKELVLVEHITGIANRPIERGDVVAARFPADPNHTKLIKRVIGLPGDDITVANGVIQVNGQTIDEPYHPTLGTPPYFEQSGTLADNQYFLVGDNRPDSSDSRLWGPVERSDIEGRVAFVLYPFSKAQYIGHTSYSFAESN